MRLLEEGKLAIDSAYEADRLGRLAMYGDSDETKQRWIVHHDAKGHALNRITDESIFITRVIEHGELIIPADIVKRIHQAIGVVKATRQPYRSVTPHEVDAYDMILKRSVNATADYFKPLNIGTEALQAELDAARSLEEPTGGTIVIRRLGATAI